MEKAVEGKVDNRKVVLVSYSDPKPWSCSCSHPFLAQQGFVLKLLHHVWQQSQQFCFSKDHKQLCYQLSVGAVQKVLILYWLWQGTLPPRMRKSWGYSMSCSDFQSQSSYPQGAQPCELGGRDVEQNTLLTVLEKHAKIFATPDSTVCLRIPTSLPLEMEPHLW